MANVRTTTTLISALAISADTPAIAQGEAATALQTDTVEFSIHGKLKVSGAIYSSIPIVVFFKTVPYDNTDGIRNQNIGDAERLELLAERPGQFKVMSSKPRAPLGAYLHWWVEIPKLKSAATLTVTLVESTGPAGTGGSSGGGTTNTVVGTTITAANSNVKQLFVAPTLVRSALISSSNATGVITVGFNATTPEQPGGIVLDYRPGFLWDLSQVYFKTTNAGGDSVGVTYVT